MTREFNTQRQNDKRSSFRHSGQPTRHQDKQKSSYTARPRLNRETVDRAWENGATRTQPDYHPRQNGYTGTSSHTSWNKRPHDGRNTGERQPHEMQESQRQSPPAIYGPNSFQRFGPNRNDHQAHSHFGTQRSDYRARNNDERRNGAYDRQNPRGARGGFGTRQTDNRDGYPRSDRYRTGENEYQTRGERYSERYEDRPRRQNNAPYAHNARNNRPQSHADSFRHDRIQQDHRDHRDHRDYQDRSGYRSEQRFEGDYEQFSQGSRPERFQPRQENDRHSQRQQRNKRERAPRTEISRNETSRNEKSNWNGPERSQQEHAPQERHVTPLPDGRVLKGSRPHQRKQAIFWTEINEEADDLIEHASKHKAGKNAPARHPDIQKKHEARPQSANVSAAASSRTRHHSSSSRKDRQARLKRTQSSSRVSQSSQRGFKWPSRSM